MTSSSNFVKLVAINFFYIFQESLFSINGQIIDGTRDCGSFASVFHLTKLIAGDRIRDYEKNTEDISPLKDIGGIAALHNSETDLRSSTHKCGACLISDRYLLTAAHCMNSSKFRLVSISLGREDLNSNPFRGDDTYIIQDVYFHPGYGSSTRYNDIAIIKTDRRVEFNSKIWPLCLPEPNQKFRDFFSAHISGWGFVNQTHKASLLQTSFVRMVENSRCEREWIQKAPQHYEFTKIYAYPQGLTDQIICAGRYGVDACGGDSGGPLHYVNSRGETTLIGLIARGIDNCPITPITPGYYTNVANYIDWIIDITGIRADSASSKPNSNVDGRVTTDCNDDCGIEPPPVCGTNDKTYPNICWLKYVACQTPQENIAIKYPGKCKETTTQRQHIFTPEASPIETEPEIIDIPTEEECGISLSNIIIGGQVVARNSWPWLAAIGRMKDARFEPFCGGTLITKQHVISAAHCFKNNDQSQSRIIVRLGEHNTNVDEDGAEDFTIVGRRENHNKSTKENDIIILKLDRPIHAFEDNIRAACLPHHLADLSLEGKKLTVVGWGAFDNRRLSTPSSVPLQVNVPTVPIQECQQKYKKIDRNNTLIINDNQICAGKSKADSCKGDSGGPLNYLDNEKERFYIVGVVSFGPKLCGDENLPGVYARVDRYLDWIKNSIREM